MQRDKPLIAPKPTISDIRLKQSSGENSSRTVDSDIIVNGKCDGHETFAVCPVLNEAGNEINCSPKPKRTSPPCPAPKPRPKNKILETKTYLSESCDHQSDSESASVISVSTDIATIRSEEEVTGEVITNASSAISDSAAKCEKTSSFPVKPPRNKKKKLSIKSETAVDSSLSTGEQNDISATKEKLRDHLVLGSKVKHELRVKTDLVASVIEETKDLSISGDSGRLHRSPSYEKALEDGFGGFSFEKESKRTRSASSDPSDGSNCYQNMDGNVLSVCRVVPLPAKREINRVNETCVASVGDELCVDSIALLQPTRSAPPPPPSKAPFMNRKKKSLLENGTSIGEDHKCITPNNSEKVAIIAGSAPPPPSKAPFMNRKKKSLVESDTSVKEDHKCITPNNSGMVTNSDKFNTAIPEGKSNVSCEKQPRSRSRSDYVNVTSENLSIQFNVKRSSSDSVKKLPMKSIGQQKKSGDSDKVNKEKDRHKSIFYRNIDSPDVIPENDEQSSVSEWKKMQRHSDAYLLPVSHESDSCCFEDATSESTQHYENVEVDLVSKASLSQSSRKLSDLDVFIPVMRNAMEESSDTYSEINELDQPIPIQNALVDEEGYSVINVDMELDERIYENDSDYIYPDNWTGSSSNPHDSDSHICSTNDKNSEEVFVSPDADTSHRYLFDTPRSNLTSCDLDHSTPLSSNVSRSSSAASADAAPENSEKKMKRSKTKAFLTAQEILTSEKTFVDVLRLLSQEFISAMNAASMLLGRQVIAPSLLNQIIKFLPELLRFNEELYEDLNSRILNWEEDPRIADIFVKKGPFLKLYTNYIREFNSMVALLDDTRQKNPDFDNAVTEFENAFCPVSSLTLMQYTIGGYCKTKASHCAKLALKHYMLKPIQRIPQYQLLLTEYRKQLNEDSPDYKDAGTAIRIVHDVAEHANQSMKYGDNLNRLLEIQNTLVGQFEVVIPGRTLLKEGILMKLSRKEMQPRMFFLFSDVLLYTTPLATSGFKVNKVMQLSTMKVTKPMKEDFQNEFSVISTQRSFTVSAKTEQEKTEWLAAMEEAIANNKMKRKSYALGKLIPSSVVNTDIDVVDFVLGTKAPVWIPDDRVSMCMVCTDEFKLLFRRHHCRGCGKVICNKCSSYEAPLCYLQYKTERVCKECFETLYKVIDEVENLVPDVVGAGASPDGNSQEDIKFMRQNLKNQFRSLAVDVGASKLPLRPRWLEEVNASDVSVDMSGYLHLWKDRKWKKTWFVLKQKVLYTFKASEDAAAEKSMPLLGYEITPFETNFQGVESNLVFELKHPGMPLTIFKTENSQSRDKWMLAMQDATIP